MDLFVHSSGPFGGPFSDWGGSSEPREPPLATALQWLEMTVLKLFPESKPLQERIVWSIDHMLKSLGRWVLGDLSHMHSQTQQESNFSQLGGSQDNNRISRVKVEIHCNIINIPAACMGAMLTFHVKCSGCLSST